MISFNELLARIVDAIISVITTVVGDFLLGDILRGIFFPFFLTVATANTPCGTPGPHANINGDSVIDLLDLVFVSGNSLQTSEPLCCSGGRAASADGPFMSISVNELRRTRQYDLIPADVNRDGMLDVGDIVSLIEGGVPVEPVVDSVRQSRPVKRTRPPAKEATSVATSLLISSTVSRAHSHSGLIMRSMPSASPESTPLR